MRKTLAWLFFNLVLFAVVLGLALAWRLSRGPIPLRALHARLEKAISSIAPALRAQIEHAELAWVHHLPEVRVLGVRVMRSNGEVVASLPEVGLRPSLRGLAHGMLALERLSVYGVQLSIVRDKEGRLMLGSSSGAGSPPTPIDLSPITSGDVLSGEGASYLKRVHLRDAKLSFEDRASGSRWAIEKGNIFVGRNWTEARVEVSGAVSMESPRSERLPRFAASLTLAATAPLGLDRALGDVAFGGRIETGRADLGGESGSLALRALDAEGVLSPAARTVEVKSLAGSIGASEVALTAKASIDAPLKGLVLAGELRSLPVADVERLWPRGPAEAVRQWIGTNIRGGAVPRARFAIRLPSDEGHSLPPDAVDVKFDLEGLTVDYLHGLEPARAIRGSAVLDAAHFAAALVSAEVGRLHVDAATVDIPFHQPHVKVTADVSGPSEEILVVLGQQPLEITQKIGLPTRGLGGSSRSRLEIDVPIHHDLRSSDVLVKANGTLADAALPDLVAGVGFERGTLGVVVEGRRVAVQGGVAITGVPGATEPARLAVSFLQGAEGSLHRLEVTIDSREVALAGFAMLDGRTLKTATVKHAHLGENELAGQIENDGGRLHATIDGKSLDLEPLWREGEGPSRLSSEQASFDVDFRVKRVKVAHGVELADAGGSVHGESGRVQKLQATAKVAGGQLVKFDLGPVERGRRLRISGDEAGQVLRAFGLHEGAEGGKLSFTADFPDADPGAKVSGRLQVDDIRVTRAPILARVLSLASFEGLADLVSGGEGIVFTHGRFPYTWGGGTIEIKDGRAVGTIGLTVDGVIDSKRRHIDVRGRVIPSYTLNSALGKVPFVGEFLVGGKGEGIFGVNYGVSGDLDKPEVSVNPFSALAPGVLRKLFIDPFQ